MRKPHRWSWRRPRKRLVPTENPRPRRRKHPRARHPRVRHHPQAHRRRAPRLLPHHLRPQHRRPGTRLRRPPQHHHGASRHRRPQRRLRMPRPLRPHHRRRALHHRLRQRQRRLLLPRSRRKHQARRSRDLNDLSGLKRARPDRRRLAANNCRSASPVRQLRKLSRRLRQRRPRRRQGPSRDRRRPVARRRLKLRLPAVAPSRLRHPRRGPDHRPALQHRTPHRRRRTLRRQHRTPRRQARTRVQRPRTWCPDRAEPLARRRRRLAPRH